MTIDLDQDVQIAAALPRTWPYFFESFGRLTPVQRVAIPPILAGADALVESATATGKTEAACAPLVERCLSFGHPWTILYISPTRALVNDLFERLELPLGQLRLRLDRRTGEYRPPSGPHINVLITTPESFDSMLCRGKTSSPVGHSLAAVTSVVLDEVHLWHRPGRASPLAAASITKAARAGKKG